VGGLLGRAVVFNAGTYWCYWKPLHGGREYYEYIFAAD